MYKDLIDLDYFEYKKRGYHGHVPEVINDILDNNKFKFSKKKNNYLGDGVYFFEDDLKLTIRWCERARKYDSYCIVKAKIKANKLINLNNNIHFEEINKFFKRIINWYDELDGDRVITRKKLFEALHRLEPYEVLKCTIKVPYGGIVPYTPIPRNQVIICVRDHNCISEIEEVITNEC